MSQNNIFNQIRKMRYLQNYKDSDLNNLIVASLFNSIQLTQSSLEDIEDFVVDGGDDLSIDVIAKIKKNKSHNICALIQHTTSSKKNNDKIISAFHRMERFIKNFYTNYDYQIKNTRNKKLWQKTREVIEDSKVKSFEYIFIADFDSSNITQDTWDAVNENKNKGWKLIDQKTFNHLKLQWFIKKTVPEYISEDKPNIYIYQSDLSDESEISKDKEVQFLVLKSRPLVQAFNLHKNALFNSNVRYYLGTGTKTNKSILSTINQGDKGIANFLKFNNGVTIICSGIEINKPKQTYTLWNSEIINGAQTTCTLASLDDDDSIFEKINVPIKIIKGKYTKDEIKEIAKNSNSQNSINDRDLVSNSKEQLRLQKYFHENEVLLEIKRNEFEKNASKKWGLKFIRNDRLGQVFIATILNKPWESKSKKNSIFSDEDLYEKVFKLTYPKTFYKLYLIYEKVSVFCSKKNDKSVYKLFDLFLVNYIFKLINHFRDEDNFEEVNTHEIISSLEQIKSSTLDEILIGMVDYLRENDKDDEDEKKSDRDLSISSNSFALLENYFSNTYKSILKTIK